MADSTGANLINTALTKPISLLVGLKVFLHWAANAKPSHAINIRAAVGGEPSVKYRLQWTNVLRKGTGLAVWLFSVTAEGSRKLFCVRESAATGEYETPPHCVGSFS